MTYFPIQPKIQVYIDSLGDPLDDGYIYFGKANLDPTLYPAKVSWDESGLYPVEFPVRTMNGYPLRNNVPAQMFIHQEDNYEFSVLINDEDEVEVFSSTTEGLIGYFPSTGAAGDADTLEGHPASYFAVDSLAAHLAGTEIFTGQKTFTTSPILSNSVGLQGRDTGATARNLAQIGGSNIAVLGDTAIGLRVNSSVDPTYYNGTNTYTFYHAGNDSALAHIAGAETFTGEKTFNAIAHFASDIFHIVGSTASDGSMRIYHNSTTNIFSFTPYKSGAIVPTKQLFYDDGAGEWGIEGAPTIEGNAILTSADIEESTFTPVLIGLTTAGTGTYTTQYGNYQKIGNWVRFRLNLNWTAHTGTGVMAITGLPYTANATNSVNLSISSSNLTYTGDFITAIVGAGTTQISLYNVNSGSALTGITIDTSAILYIQGSYRTV